MQTKAHSTFDMKVLRRRAKKLLRKKYKKTIKLSDVDKIWKEYCEYAVIRPLIKYGSVDIDNNTKIEIVGQRKIDNQRVFNLLSKGKKLVGKSVVNVSNFANVRREYIYRIRLTDNTFKGGKLVFKADSKLSNRVHKALVETTNYYRIEK